MELKPLVKMDSAASKDVISALTALVILIMSFAGILLGVEDLLLLNLVLSTAVFILLILITRSNVSVQLCFLVGFATFMYFPAVVNGAVLDTSFELYYLSSVIAVVFLRATKSLVHQQQELTPSWAPGLFSASSLILIALILVLPGNVSTLMPLYTIAYALSLDIQHRSRNCWFFFVYVAVFVTYAVYGWSGFGRAQMFGWLAVAFIYFLYAMRIRVSRLFFAVVPSFFATLLTSRDLTSMRIVDIETLLRDSAFGPYRLATTFIEVAQTRGLDISGFTDQVKFSLFVFVPRSIWPEKPFGFGYEYTVRHLDSYLIEAGHSIAGTFIGEHLYYLGYFGLMTSIVMVVVIWLACRWTYSLTIFKGLGVIVPACVMPGLVWGGMSSFAARLVVPMIVLLLAAVTMRLLLPRNRLVGEIDS